MPVQDNEKELNPVQENIPETNKEALVPVLNAIFENQKSGPFFRKVHYLCG